MWSSALGARVDDRRLFGPKDASGRGSRRLLLPHRRRRPSASVLGFEAFRAGDRLADAAWSASTRSPRAMGRDPEACSGSAEVRAPWRPSKSAAAQAAARPAVYQARCRPDTPLLVRRLWQSSPRECLMGAINGDARAAVSSTRRLLIRDHDCAAGRRWRSRSSAASGPTMPARRARRATMRRRSTTADVA